MTKTSTTTPVDIPFKKAPVISPRNQLLKPPVVISPRPNQSSNSNYFYGVSKSSTWNDYLTALDRKDDASKLAY